MQKLLRMLSRIAIGLVIFYFILGFIIVPLALVWGVSSQGSKILKHPVGLSWAFFNPLTLSLDLKGFTIKDQQQQLMVGFDRLNVDVSFLKLLQGQYLVEKVLLEGLVVNAVLFPEGKINLLDLVPQTTPNPEQSMPVSGSDTLASSTPVTLPIVDVTVVDLKNISLNFKDTTVMPNFQTRLHQLNIHVQGVSTRPEAQFIVMTTAVLDDKGLIESQAMVSPFVTPLALEANVKLNDYAMTVLTPYVGKYTGRSLAKGKIDFKMDYRVADNQINAGHKILIQDFTFGDKVESKDALNLPFGLAIALLEDPQGRININLPVKGDMSAPDFEYMGLVWQVARNFFIKLVTKPFTFLMTSVLGEADTGSDDLGYIKFDVGSDQLSQEAKSQIELLVKALKERPKLRLEINGSYDELLDWKAIKTATFEHDFNALRQDSTRKDTWVYQTLYQRKFGVRALWALTNKYQDKATGQHDEVALNQAIKQELIEKAPADKVALEALAMSRAKVVYDQFLLSDFDPLHLSIGPTKSVQASLSKVTLEFTLTVFDEPVTQAGDK